MMRSGDKLATLHRILRGKVIHKCLWFSIIQPDAIVLAQNLVVSMANAHKEICMETFVSEDELL